MCTRSKDDKRITSPHTTSPSQSVTIEAWLTKKVIPCSSFNENELSFHVSTCGKLRPVIIILLGFNHNNVRGGFTVVLSAVAAVGKAILKG
jgi:hypothetical protein